MCARYRAEGQCRYLYNVRHIYCIKFVLRRYRLHSRVEVSVVLVVQLSTTDIVANCSPLVNLREFSFQFFAARFSIVYITGRITLVNVLGALKFLKVSFGVPKLSQVLNVSNLFSIF